MTDERYEAAEEARAFVGELNARSLDLAFQELAKSQRKLEQKVASLEAQVAQLKAAKPIVIPATVGATA